MRGPGKEAIVCRGRDGHITKVEELRLVKDRYPILGLPLLLEKTFPLPRTRKVLGSGLEAGTAWRRHSQGC